MLQYAEYGMVSSENHLNKSLEKSGIGKSSNVGHPVMKFHQTFASYVYIFLPT